MPNPADPIVEIIELDTRLFRNCLSGTDDEMIRRRITENTNSLHFLGCHLVDARFFLLRMIGEEAAPPFPELDSVRTIDEMPVPGPSLEEILDAWNRVSPLLAERIRALTVEKLSSESPTRFPSVSATLLGGLTFLVQHESYHIGQMALVRKGLGFHAMSYS